VYTLYDVRTVGGGWVEFFSYCLENARLFAHWSSFSRHMPSQYMFLIIVDFLLKFWGRGGKVSRADQCGKKSRACRYRMAARHPGTGRQLHLTSQPADHSTTDN
jgi:hypothetical protein